MTQAIKFNEGVMKDNKKLKRDIAVGRLKSGSRGNKKDPIPK